jgi:hypothetical protein
MATDHNYKLYRKYLIYLPPSPLRRYLLQFHYSWILIYKLCHHLQSQIPMNVIDMCFIMIRVEMLH